MSIIRDAIQYIVNLGNVQTKEINGQQYATDNLKRVPEPTTDGLILRNLTGLVDYLKANYDKLEPVLVQVESPTMVNVYSTFNRDKVRNHILTSKAQLPDIVVGRNMKVENFIIHLQSCFVQNEDTAELLSIVGNLKEETVRTTGDSGVAQQVTVKTGITTVENKEVPNRVNLKPFRTFSEVKQPESTFVFRMEEGPHASIHEADGGAWKILAIHAIRDYLQKELAAEIENKFVTIIA